MYIKIFIMGVLLKHLGSCIQQIPPLNTTA